MSNRRLRWIICFFVLTSMLNLIFGIYVVTTIVSINDFEKRTKNLSIFNVTCEPTSSMIIQRKIEYDYYFRIDYTILKGVCQPIYFFNTSETIHSIENTTNQRVNQILSQNIKIDLQILRINTKIEKSHYQLKQRSIKATRFFCDYLVELFVGINFPSHCNYACRSVELRRLTSDINQLGNSALTFSVRKRNSKGALIEYYIQNIVLFQTVKYFEQIVFIQTVEQNRYISITVLDSNAYQTSVSMSINDKSLFIIKKSLASLDPSIVSVSFASLALPNLYLRHQDGRVILTKNDETDLFRQDATFKLMVDNQKEVFAFQAINLADSFYLALDNETNATLVIIKLEPHITIDKLDKRFLFRIIATT